MILTDGNGFLEFPDDFVLSGLQVLATIDRTGLSDESKELLMELLNLSFETLETSLKVRKKLGEHHLNFLIKEERKNNIKTVK